LMADGHPYLLVPSLDGSLYMFNMDSNALDPIPLNTGISVMVGEDAVAGGSIVSTTLRVSITGQLEAGVPLPSPNHSKWKILMKNKRLKADIGKLQMEQFLREGKLDEEDELTETPEVVIGEDASLPPEAGRGVELRFAQFDLEKEANCEFDYVEVFDGLDRSDEHKMGHFCGDELPPVFVSTGKKMLLVLNTDDSEERKGFVAQYRSSASVTARPVTKPTPRPSREPVVNND
ncbi:Zinc metalloproteinase nas-39, partial [Toxocara canis]